jgi:hypothetical protein
MTHRNKVSAVPLTLGRTLPEGHYSPAGARTALMKGVLPPDSFVRMGFNLPFRAELKQRYIPRNFTIFGSFCIASHPDFDYIESDFRVLRNDVHPDWGNFDARNCPNLQTIGDRMRIAGDCNLSNCPKLTSIGADAEVGGDLIVTDSPLVSFRGRIRVGGRIFLPKNFDFSTLKDIFGANENIHF